MKRKDITKRENKDLKVGTYDYEGLSHWWIYNYGYKSTANNRMHCTRNTMYSYNTAIAVMVDKNTILLSNRSYSNTTAKHIYAIKNAANHMTILKVNDVEANNKSSHIKNLEESYELILDIAGKSVRARSDYMKDHHLACYYNLITTAKQYAKLFKIRTSSIYKKIAKLKEPNKDELKIILLKDEQNKIKNIAKKLKQRKIEQAKQFDKAQKDLLNWLKGGPIYPNSNYLDKTYIRINGDLIETTQYARASLKACKIAYKKFKTGALKIGESVSGFEFRGTDKNNIGIGCHTIELNQIEQLLGDK